MGLAEGFQQLIKEKRCEFDFNCSQMHISPPYLLIMLALWNILLFITVLDRKYKEQILLKQTKLDLRQQ